MQDRNYEEFYNKITKDIRRSSHGVRILQVTDQALRYVMELFYPLFLLWRFQVGGLSEVLTYILLPGIAFVIFSLIRDWINRKRPYEEWQIDPLIYREGSGHSMPSRHVFSAAMIGMCALSVNALLGIVCLALAAVIAVCRVLGGVHYPEDVIIGYVVGAAVGAFLLII